MALIKCMECGKDISDRALSCPHCGLQIEEKQVKSSENKSIFSGLPANLHIGKTMYNLRSSGSSPGFHGRVVKNEHVKMNKNIINENLKFILHTHGIELSFGISKGSFNIHNSQIIELIHTSKTELVKDNKSVIGRSIIGGVLLGPLGAIVGGMSGIGYKEKFADEHYLIINYWDKDTKQAETLIILSEESYIKDFIKYHEQNAKENQLKGHVAEEETYGITEWLLLIGAVFIVISLLSRS